jgi:hypothetical protein
MLGLQLVVGCSVIPELIKIRNKTLSNKPQGAFWTSSLQEDGRSAWVEWCEDEEFNVPETWEGFVLRPNAATNIITVNTLEDLQQLAPYEKSYEGVVFTQEYDFEQMLRDGIEAIHLTEEGQWRTRHTRPNLYGWDMESTCWLYPAFEVIGKVSFPSNIKGDD